MILLLALTVILLDAQEDFKVFNQDNLDSIIRRDFIKQGQCRNVSNIKSIGAAGNIGTFRGAGSVLGMESGIVFSTGFLNNIATTNKLPDNTGQLNQGSDPDLQRLASRPVQDAVGLEFDFVPNADVVTFDYVFASEEYCEFVDDIFNDVFGFFASGPGINGEFESSGINVAVIPSTQEKVSINTVNHKTNESLYVSNLTPIDAAACNLPFKPEDLQRIEFDGYTVRMRATIPVIPCQTYHLRLVVGDVADDILDSGVFLAANSFDLGSAVDVTSWVGDTIGETFFENCLDAKFVFEKRIFTRDTVAEVFNYSVGGTAIGGLDYEELPGRILIPANQTTAEVPIRVIADDLAEPVETIILVVEYFSCDCIERDTAILYLGDSDYPFDVQMDPVAVCQSQPFELRGEVVGGAAPFTYQWSTGDTTEVVGLTLDTITDLSLVVEDFCGARASANTQISFREPPHMKILGDPFFCEPSSLGSIQLDFEGVAPWSLSFQQDGTSYSFDGINDSPFTLPVGSGSEINFLSFRDRFCVGELPTSITPVLRRPSYEASVRQPSCLFVNDGQIRLTPIDFDPVQISWQRDVFAGDLVRDSLSAGWYTFRLTDQDGCWISDSIQLSAAMGDRACRSLFEGQVYIPSAFSPNSDGTNDFFQIFPRENFIRSLSFNLFNRWGHKVFQSSEFLPSESVLHAWDGADHGMSTYVCVVKLTLLDDSVVELVQDVVLLR